MEVHPRATAFARVAGRYERARPDYPAAAIEALARGLRLGPGRTVVDLAAGTGKLTRQLVPTGARIVAIEPLEAMRAQLQAAVPGVEALAGTAESMPLPVASADAVTVASAFHWFRGAEALSEIHRVLRPGGGLALVSNRRDRADPLWRALSEILDRLQDGDPVPDPARALAIFDEVGLFAQRETLHVPHSQELAADELVDRVVSISYVAALPAPELASVLGEVRALAESLPQRFRINYDTEVRLYARCGARQGASGAAPDPSP